MHLELEPGGLEEALTGRRWSSAETRGQVAARRTRYRSLGVLPGDRVFLHFGNDLEFFGDLLAVWQLGACAVPIDGRLTPFELDRLAGAAQPRLALFHGEIAPERERGLRALGARVEQTLPDAEARTFAVDAARDAGLTLDGDALILFTSGTTGDPKGVVHTHRSLRARWMSLRHHLGVSRFRRTLCLLPTHFGHGLICNALFPWLAGLDLCIAPPFKPELVMQLGRLIDEREITFLSSVPALWRLALRTARAPEGGTLERIHCGSAPLSAHLWNQIREWAGTTDVCNAYGITETGSWVAGLTRGATEPEDGLIGEPWGAVVKVLKSPVLEGDLIPDLLCAPGESGYVWLNTPALMKGYWNRDDLTQSVVANGWFLTGDIGSLDERGRLYLRGREREEINKGGAKIYPADIDAVVERFPGTQDVCTFALEDRLYGQNVGLAVVLGDRGDAALRRLHGWLKRHVADYQMPIRWYLLDEIPRTSRGKINRDTVAQECSAQSPVDLHRLLGEER